MALDVELVTEVKTGSPVFLTDVSGTPAVAYEQLPPYLSDYAGRFSGPSIGTGDIGLNKWGWWWNTTESKLILVRNVGGALFGVEATPL